MRQERAQWPDLGSFAAIAERVAASGHAAGARAGSWPEAPLRRADHSAGARTGSARASFTTSITT